MMVVGEENLDEDEDEAASYISQSFLWKIITLWHYLLSLLGFRNGHKYGNISSADQTLRLQPNQSGILSSICQNIKYFWFISEILIWKKSKF